MPGWVIAAAFAVPGVIMLLIVRWAVKGRARQGRHRRAEGRRRDGQALDRGSAALIPDGGEYKSEALLRALSIKPEDHGPDDEGNPHDEGWGATMLGLRSKSQQPDRPARSPPVLGPARGGSGVRPHRSRREDRGRQRAVLRAPPALHHRAARGRAGVRAGGLVGPAASGRVRAGAGRTGPGGGWRQPGSVGEAGGGRRAQGHRGHATIRRAGVRWLGLRPVAAGAPGRRNGARCRCPNARVGPAWKVPYGLGRSTKAER